MFRVIPDPLTINESGLVDPNISNQFVNIPGTSQPWKEPIKSYLIDLHLGDEFVEDVTQKIIIMSVKKCSSFELLDKAIRNKVISDTEQFYYFRNKLENISYALNDDALEH